MQQLAAMQLAEHLEDAGDLAAGGGFRPAAAGALKKRAEVAVRRVLEGEAVQDAMRARPRPHQRKRVEDANRARVAVEQLAEVGFAQPAVDALADLDADRLRDRRRRGAARRQIDLAEAAFAEPALDSVVQAGLRADDGLRRRRADDRLARSARGRPSRCGWWRPASAWRWVSSCYQAQDRGSSAARLRANFRRGLVLGEFPNGHFCSSLHSTDENVLDATVLDWALNRAGSTETLLSPAVPVTATPMQRKCSVILSLTNKTVHRTCENSADSAHSVVPRLL